MHLTVRWGWVDLILPESHIEVGEGAPHIEVGEGGPHAHISSLAG